MGSTIVIHVPDLTCVRKALPVLAITAKALAIVLLSYLLICSLDLLGSAFQLIGGTCFTCLSI